MRSFSLLLVRSSAVFESSLVLRANWTTKFIAKKCTINNIISLNAFDKSLLRLNPPDLKMLESAKVTRKINILLSHIATLAVTLF